MWCVACVVFVLCRVQEALKLDPDNKRAMVMRNKVRLMEQKKEAGNKAFSSGSPQEAIDLYTEALAVDPLNEHYNATLYNNRLVHLPLPPLHTCYLLSHLLLSLISSHLISAVLGFVLWRFSAAAYMKANNFSAAVADCSRCIDLAPDNVKAHLRRAKCHGELNNWDEVRLVLCCALSLCLLALTACAMCRPFAITSALKNSTHKTKVSIAWCDQA